MRVGTGYRHVAYKSAINSNITKITESSLCSRAHRVPVVCIITPSLMAHHHRRDANKHTCYLRSAHKEVVRLLAPHRTKSRMPTIDSRRSKDHGSRLMAVEHHFLRLLCLLNCSQIRATCGDCKQYQRAVLRAGPQDNNVQTVFCVFCANQPGCCLVAQSIALEDSHNSPVTEVGSPGFSLFVGGLFYGTKHTRRAPVCHGT